MKPAYEKVFDTKELSREEWLEKRRELGLGGSEMAAVLGYSKWSSPIDVWLDKRGELPPKEDNEYMYFGRILEEVVANEFEIRTGKRVRKNNYMLRSVEYPWLFADIDREIVGEDAGLECKTTASWNEKEWEGDNVPDSYYIQVQHYMAVTGKASWWLAVLIGGNKFIYKEVPRNEEVIKAIVEEGGKFWRMVQEGIMPAVDGTEQCQKALQGLHKESTPCEIELLPSASKLIKEYEEAKQEEASWKERKMLAQNKLCSLLGDAEVGVVGDYKVTWKFSKGRETFDKKSFAKDYPDLCARYTSVGAPVRNYFRVK